MNAIKSCGILMSFCYIFTSTCASSEVFDGVLGNTASCHKTCQMTYSLHTYPRVSVNQFRVVYKQRNAINIFSHSLVCLIRSHRMVAYVSNVKSFVKQQQRYKRKWTIFCIWPVCFVLGGGAVRLSERMSSLLHLSVCG